MRITLALVVIILSLMEIGFCATYIKVSDEKIGVITEATQEMTVAEIKHEISGITADISRIEASKQPFLDRMAKYEELLRQCDTLNIKEPVIAPAEPIKTIEDIVPDGDPAVTEPING